MGGSMTGLLINGQLHYVSEDDNQDFIDLVEKYMGCDSAKYLIDILENIEYENQYMKHKIEKVKDKLDYDNEEVWKILQEE
jgi:hypothetical protein